MMSTEHSVSPGGLANRRRGPAGRASGLTLLLSLWLLAGCAPTSVQETMQSYASEPRPDRILIYDFAVSPDEVKLDTGLSAELMDRYKHLQSGSARTAQELKIGHTVANVVAAELVKQIQSYGLWAERAMGYPVSKGKTLIVKGQFLSIDEGNRTERVVIGFGAGRTDVQANVQVYEMTAEGQKEVESLRASGESGAKPGMAEMMGIGALTHHLLASTLVSGSLSTAGELKFETVESDGRRLGDKIAAQLGQYFVSQGWIPAGAVKAPSRF
jgi:hypothetical protein